MFTTFIEFACYVVFISSLAADCLLVCLFATTYSFIVFAWLFVYSFVEFVMLALFDSSNESRLVVLAWLVVSAI